MTLEESLVKTISSLITLSLTDDKTAPGPSANAINGSHMLSTNTNPSGANPDTEFGQDLPAQVNSLLLMNATSVKLVLHAVKLTLITISFAAVTSPKVPGFLSGLMTVLWTAVT